MWRETTLLIDRAAQFATAKTHVFSDEQKRFPGFTALRSLDEIQKLMTESQCEPEQFKGRITFMSMYSIDWEKGGNIENCIANAHRVSEYAPRFKRGPRDSCQQT